MIRSPLAALLCLVAAVAARGQDKSPDVLIRQAKDHQQKKEYQAAADEWEKVVKEFPADERLPLVRNSLAVCRTELGRAALDDADMPTNAKKQGELRKEAIRQLQLALKEKPPEETTAAARYLLGVAQSDAVPADAVATFEQFLTEHKANPLVPEVKVRAAELLLAKEPKKAVAYADDVVTKFPKSAWATPGWRVLACGRRALKENDAAREAAAKLLAVYATPEGLVPAVVHESEDVTFMRGLLGVWQAEDGLPKDAVKTARTAFDLVPKTGVNVVIAVARKLSVPHPAAAADLVSYVLEPNKDNGEIKNDGQKMTHVPIRPEFNFAPADAAELKYLRGCARQGLKQWAGAEADFNAALKGTLAEPLVKDAQTRAADCGTRVQYDRLTAGRQLLADGKSKEAATALDQLRTNASTGPYAVAATYFAGKAYAAGGDRPTAILRFEAVADDAKFGELAVLAAGDELLADKKVKEARVWFTKIATATPASPRRADADVGLGRCLQADGQFAAAAAAFVQVVEVRKNAEPEARGQFHLAECLAAQNKFREAASAYGKVAAYGNLPFAAVAELRAAKQYEQLGDATAARFHYERLATQDGFKGTPEAARASVWLKTAK